MWNKNLIIKREPNSTTVIPRINNDKKASLKSHVQSKL